MDEASEIIVLLNGRDLPEDEFALVASLPPLIGKDRITFGVVNVLRYEP